MQKRFGQEIRDDVLERAIPDALSSAIEERKLSVLGRPLIEGLTWEPPGPIRFTARLDIKPPVDPGEYRGVPVEDVSVEPTEQEVAAGRRPPARRARRVPPDRGAGGGAGDFAVADIAGSFIEILAPGQNPRTFKDEKITLEVGHPDSMPEINEALRGTLPGQTQKIPEELPRRLPQRGVPGQDRGLRADRSSP